jgi:glycosyltransferase involved in cell wall biosynthesis
MNQISNNSALQPLEKLRPIELPPLPNQPLVSILMANYNYGRYIGEALHSALRQTYPHFEVIVCDDGSTDDSREVVSRYCERDPRIRLLTKENGGLASALNCAFAASQGEIVCLLDADDIFLPEKLEHVVKAFLRCHDCGLCIHRVLKIDEHARPFSYARPAILLSGWLAQEALLKGTHVRSLPPASGLSFRRPVLDLLFPVSTRLRRVVDAYISHTAQLITKLCAVPEALSNQRIHASNITSGRTFHTSMVSRLIEDTRLLNILQREFLAQHYGAPVAQLLGLENHSHYWSFLLLSHILSGSRSQMIGGEPAALALTHLHDKKQRLLARILLALPRRFALMAIDLWTGQSAGTAVLANTFRSLLRI